MGAFIYHLWLLGYLTEHVASALMVYKLYTQKTMYGISIDTQICLLLTTFARVIWMQQTVVADYPLYHFEITCAIVTHLLLVGLCFKYKDSVYKGIKSIWLQWYTLAALCGVLALWIHPGEKNKYGLSIYQLTSFNIFLEGIALLPQMVHVRSSKDLEGLTSKYLYCLGVSRLLRIGYWWEYMGSDDDFMYLAFADVVHTGILGWFFYVFRKATKEA